MAISQKWKDTVDRGITDKRWDDFDAVIKTEIAAYNKRFGKSFDWKYVKAMIWTESGGPDNPSWKKRVMQIGNPGDAAYGVLTSGKEGTSLIMSDALKKELKVKSNIDKPKINIKAGTAYLIARLAKYQEKSVRDAKDKKEYSYTVVGGDSLWKIAKKEGTTVDELKASNPSKKSGHIKKGDVLKYHKAKMTTVVSAWRNFDTATIAARYNGGGDSNYKGKLDYVINDVFPKLKR